MTLDAFVIQAGDSGIAPPKALRTASTVEMLVQEGMAVIRHDLPRASNFARAAIKGARNLRDPKLIGIAERLKGHTLLLSGRARRAVPCYVNARASLKEFPEERAATAVAMLQALAYIGDYDQAFEVAGEALDYFRTAGDAFRAARVEANLANALHRLDRLEEARSHYESATRVLADVGATADLAIVTRNFGVCLMGLLDFDAADRLYTTSRAQFQGDGLSSLVYEVDLNRAYLYGRQGQLQRALELYRQLKSSLPEDLGFELGHCFLDQADFMLESGLWTDAARAAQQAFVIFGKLDARLEYGKAKLIEGLSYVRLKDADRGCIALNEAARRLRSDRNDNWKSLLYLARAELYRLQQRPRLAFRELLKAEALGVAPERQPLLQAELADLALDLNEREVFARLDTPPSMRAKAERQRGNLELAEVFAKSALIDYDHARSRLQASRLRQAAAQARDRDLRECFRCLSHPWDRLGVVVRLKNQALAELTELPEYLPNYENVAELGEIRNLAAGQPLPIRLPELRPRQRFVEFFSDSGSLRAFVLSQGQVQELELGTARHFEKLSRQLRFQLGRQRPGQTLELQALVNTLKATFQPLLGDAKSMIIGRDAPIQTIPFHALFPEVQVLYAPSAATWAALESRSPQGSGALVVGWADDHAPLIWEESRRVAQHLGTQPRDPRDFGREAPEAAWIHVAAHGVMREDQPLLSAMALGESNVSVLDIVGMRLNATLVTLSGCSTAGSGASPVDFEGFIDAFLVAGAKSVMAALWPVSDEATALFMDSFYAHRSRGIAIAHSIAMDLTRAEFPHMADWAAFALFGRIE